MNDKQATKPVNPAAEKITKKQIDEALAQGKTHAKFTKIGNDATS